MPNPAYPTLPIEMQSRRTLRDGRDEDVIGDGLARVRKVHADRYDFDVVHPKLSSSQWTTLANFYASNATAPAIDFVWPEDGATYVVRFGAKALASDPEPGGYRTARVRLVAGG